MVSEWALRVVGSILGHWGAFTWSPKVHFGKQLQRNQLLFGDLWEPLGPPGELRKRFWGLWKHWGAFTWSSKLILADSCSEINVFETPWGAPGGPQTSFWQTVAAKSMISRGEGDLPPE